MEGRGQDQVFRPLTTLPHSQRSDRVSAYPGTQSLKEIKCSLIHSPSVRQISSHTLELPEKV